MENDIFFINTPVDIQDEVYYEVVEQLSMYDIAPDKVIYLKMTPIINLGGKYYFQVFVESGIVSHELLKKAPDFLIFMA